MVVGAEQIGVVGICQDTGTSAGEVEFATLLGSFCASGWDRVGPPGLTTEMLERARSLDFLAEVGGEDLGDLVF